MTPAALFDRRLHQAFRWFWRWKSRPTKRRGPRITPDVVELIRRDLKPRDIATLDAFDNALSLDVAMGGSTNTVLHTLAIAREAGIE